jgi:hypothetical protein
MNLRNEIARRYTLRDWYVSGKTRRLIGKKNADQVISEFGRWVHISVPNTVDTPARRQALTIDKSGTRNYS